MISHWRVWHAFSTLALSQQVTLCCGSACVPAFLVQQLELGMLGLLRKDRSDTPELVAVVALMLL